MKRLAVVGAYASCAEATPDRCQVFRMADSSDFCAVERFADELHQRAPLDQIIGHSPLEQRLSGYMAERLGVPGNPLRTVVALQDRHVQRLRLLEEGVPTVPAVLVAQSADIKKFVAENGRTVLRPRRTGASLASPIVDANDDVDSFWLMVSRGGADDLLAERWFSEDVTTVSAFSSSGRHRFLPGQVPDAARELAEHALRALGVQDGPTRTEIAHSAEGLRVVDCQAVLGPPDGSTECGRLPDPGVDVARYASITPYEDGPLLVRGDFRLRTPDGEPIDPRRRTVALCRCGRSAIKPFCDGTHKAVGFRAPARDQ